MDSLFGFDKFEWDQFDIFKLVSGLIKMLCYCVVSFVLYRSSVISKSVSYGSFSPSDVFRWCVFFTFTTLRFLEAHVIVCLMRWVWPVFLNVRDDIPSLMKGQVLHLIELHFFMEGVFEVNVFDLLLTEIYPANRLPSEAGRKENWRAKLGHGAFFCPPGHDDFLCRPAPLG